MHFAAHGGYGRYVLVMEDMAPARPLDQIQGVSGIDAMLAVKTIASLHAQYRGRVHEAEETMDWVQAADDPTQIKRIRDAYHNACKNLSDERYELLGLDPVEIADYRAVIEYLDETFDGLYMLDYLHNHQPQSPHSQFVTTLCHGDFRGENMFPLADGGIKVIDYQVACEGIGGDDLAYFIGGSMSTEDRRKLEPQLLFAYFEETRRQGAKDFTMEELLLTYQRGVLRGVIMFVIGQNDGAVDSERAKMLLRVMARRGQAQVRDWQLLESMKLRNEKLQDDGVTSKYSPVELRRSLPSFVHPLLR